MKKLKTMDMILIIVGVYLFLGYAPPCRAIIGIVIISITFELPIFKIQKLNSVWNDPSGVFCRQ